MNDLDSVEFVFEYFKFVGENFENDIGDVLEVMVVVVYRYLFRFGECC